MAKDTEIEEVLDLEAPRTVRDVVIQTHAIVQQILGRLERMDHRMDVLDSRIDRLESRMDRIEVRMDQLEKRMDRIGEGMEKRFLWLTGIVLTTWITLMVTILVKL